MMNENSLALKGVVLHKLRFTDWQKHSIYSSPITIFREEAQSALAGFHAGYLYRRNSQRKSWEQGSKTIQATSVGGTTVPSLLPIWFEHFYIMSTKACL